MNLKEILKYGKEELIKNNIEDASIIAKELAEYIFKITRAQLIANNDMEFSKDQTDNYINSIKKISTGIPIQYITNNQEFMNLNFYVDENVLIPQPDTETLVEEVINEYKEKKCEILDLCTGSGAIAISLAKYINESNIVASDNSGLKVADKLSPPLSIKIISKSGNFSTISSTASKFIEASSLMAVCGQPPVSTPIILSRGKILFLHKNSASSFV